MSETSFGVRVRSIFASPTMVDGTFLPGTVDEALDLRDDPVFDLEWTRVESAVSERCPYDEQAFREVEQAAYLTVQERIGPGELPAYVMDDVNLVLRANSVGHQDPWLSALLAQYVDGRFPCGVLSPDSRTLAEVVGVPGPTLDAARDAD
jgi:hypothetical protein